MMFVSYDYSSSKCKLLLQFSLHHLLPKLSHNPVFYERISMVCLCSKDEAVPSSPVLPKHKDTEVEMGPQKMMKKAEVTPDPPAANQAMKGISVMYKLM